MALNKIAALAITTAAGMASKMLFQRFVKGTIILTEPKPAPVVTPPPQAEKPELKVVRPTLRAVTEPSKSLPRQEALEKLVQTLSHLPSKGVHVKVIQDEQPPVLETPEPVRAEVVITEPRDSVKHAVAQEVLECEEHNLFWDNFVNRIAPRGTHDYSSEQELLSNTNLSKGYHLVRLTDSSEVGIVHVTKKAVNALFPEGPNCYRVVGNNKRFDGKNFVTPEKAKGFLNGRY